MHEWQTCVEHVEHGLRYTPSAPRAVRLRILLRAICELGGDPRGGVVARLEAVGGGTLGGVLARRERGVWRFSREKRRAAALR
jgi:tRNA(Ile)-lysidine synthase